MKTLTISIIKIYFAFFVVETGGKTRELRLLGMLPKTGSGWIGGDACQVSVRMALDDINNNENILKDYNLTYNWYDSKVSWFLIRVIDI